MAFHTHAHHVIHFIGWMFLGLSFMFLFLDVQSGWFWIFLGVGSGLIALGALVHYIRIRNARRAYLETVPTCYYGHNNITPPMGYSTGGIGLPPQQAQQQPLYNTQPQQHTLYNNNNAPQQSVQYQQYHPNPVSFGKATSEPLDNLPTTYQPPQYYSTTQQQPQQQPLIYTYNH
eukprot:TRINITY_DN12778_c0_g1_i1.p1 TRINITY_DN12778_c0_g1~~TRINITY_DN12778_c0_g1_i1.p1  ORF type:complete len:174 (+),score=45.78 TRINITY_DN12778_c0_g1_i1:47-568(+)